MFSVILLLFEYMYCQDHVTRNPLQPEGRFSLLKMNNFCGFAVKINLQADSGQRRQSLIIVYQVYTLYGRQVTISVFFVSLKMLCKVILKNKKGNKHEIPTY
jgi:hypothetical protein